MKKFLKQMIDNPDGSYSSKRVAGWIMMFHFITMCYLDKAEHIVTLSLGAVIGFWGLTSIDYKSYLNNKPLPDPNTPSN
jgi:hypothetical protein